MAMITFQEIEDGNIFQSAVGQPGCQDWLDLAGDKKPALDRTIVKRPDAKSVSKRLGRLAANPTLSGVADASAVSAVVCCGGRIPAIMVAPSHFAEWRRVTNEAIASLVAGD